MKPTLCERVMTTKRDRKKRVFRSTVQCTASFFCVAFWRFLGCAQNWPASYAHNFCYRLAIVAMVRQMSNHLCLLRCLYDFFFRVLGQQCKAYSSSTAFQQAFFSSFLWSPGSTCTYVRNSRQTTKYTFTIWRLRVDFLTFLLWSFRVSIGKL